MILDASAIIAILIQETGYAKLLKAIAAAPTLGVGGPTMVEAALVLTSKFGFSSIPLLSRFVQEAGIQIVDFGGEHYRAAVDAYLTYGKGRHRAALNFGDCMAYAVAKLSGLPLLYAGDDFGKTDLAQDWG